MFACDATSKETVMKTWKNLRAELLGEDTYPGAFNLLVDLVELQCVSHFGYRRWLMLYRQTETEETALNTTKHLQRGLALKPFPDCGKVGSAFCCCSSRWESSVVLMKTWASTQRLSQNTREAESSHPVSVQTVKAASCWIWVFSCYLIFPFISV